mgnify:CR=1 FL=1
MADKFTLNAIIQYLKLDSYEMVKNMPASLKEDNAVQLIAYVDWALQRNEAMVKMLTKHSVKKEVPSYIAKKK